MVNNIINQFNYEEIKLKIKLLKKMALKFIELKQFQLIVKIK